MENKSLRFYAIMALWVVLFVLLFVSNRRVDLKTDINKSTSVSVSVEDTVSLSPSVVTTRAYSAGDDTYQAFFEILQNASCYQKFNQNVRSYSHDYEAHSITLRFADDASQNLLFTVYSDGVCQVNGKFVFLRSPDGNAGAIYQLLRDAVGFDQLKAAVKKPLTGRKIAAYYGCMLLRPAKVMQMDDPENPQIVQTVRGIGYKFVTPEQ